MSKISDSDKKAWKKFITSKDKLRDKEHIFEKKKIPHSEKIIDLHGYTLDSANLEMEKFILKCFENRVTKIKVITGKGNRSKNKEDPYQSKELSILKYSVPNYIYQNKNLMKKILKVDFDSVNNPNKGNFNIILKKND